MRIRSTKIVASLVAAAVLSACSVQGGSSGGGGGAYPSRPVEFTVPTQAGGSTDLITRALGRGLEQPLGEQAVVVNKPGANGKIAGRDVFGSAPDGYRVAVMPQSLFSIGPLMLEDPDAIKLDEMTFVKGLTVEDYVLVVPANSPVRGVADLAAAGRIAYGTTGAGTGSQLSQALLFGLAKVPSAPVPFDGGGPLLNALLGGKVNAGSLQIAEAYKQIEAGTIRPLMVFGEKRVEALPNVPTATELGFQIVVDQRRFVAAPAGLPPDVRDRLAGAIDKAVASPEYNQTLRTNYIARWDANGDQVRQQLTDSLEKFRAMTQRLGVNLTG